LKTVDLIWGLIEVTGHMMTMPVDVRVVLHQPFRAVGTVVRFGQGCWTYQTTVKEKTCAKYVRIVL
jgi:hypothetical protein